MYQTRSVDTQVAPFNKGKGINYQLAEIASNKTGGGAEKNWSGKADTMFCKLPFFFLLLPRMIEKMCQEHNY